MVRQEPKHRTVAILSSGVLHTDDTLPLALRDTDRVLKMEAMMTDWDVLMRNKARSGTFVGRGAADEDAYFAAFSDETAEGETEISALAAIVSLVRATLRAPARA